MPDSRLSIPLSTLTVFVVLFLCQSVAAYANPFSNSLSLFINQNDSRSLNPPADAFETRVKKHGTDAVLRARGHVDKPQQTLKLLEPDWKNPKTLTFRNLTLNYQYYKIHKTFFEQGLPRIHGAAVTITGAIMPIDSPGKDGKMTRFWLCNPSVVMAGCVFCNPPTLADLIYIESTDEALQVDRELLYRSVITMTVTGRFYASFEKTPDGIEYLFKLDMKSYK